MIDMKKVQFWPYEGRQRVSGTPSSLGQILVGSACRRDQVNLCSQLAQGQLGAQATIAMERQRRDQMGQVRSARLGENFD